mmetsp:Transcript_24572/g.62638  ORF Transcript_24572/g.62638 Transcript_24572/m.62638 type:complete len:247 (-) Transcript_24572:241-981(-)
MEHLGGCRKGVLRCELILEVRLVVYKDELLQRLPAKTFGLAAKESCGQSRAISRHAQVVIQLHNRIAHHVEQRCHRRVLDLPRPFLDMCCRARSQSHLEAEQSCDHSSPEQKFSHQIINPDRRIQSTETTEKANEERSIGPKRHTNLQVHHAKKQSGQNACACHLLVDLDPGARPWKREQHQKGHQDTVNNPRHMDVEQVRFGISAKEQNRSHDQDPILPDVSRGGVAPGEGHRGSHHQVQHQTRA